MGAWLGVVGGDGRGGDLVGIVSVGFLGCAVVSGFVGTEHWQMKEFESEVERIKSWVHEGEYCVDGGKSLVGADEMITGVRTAWMWLVRSWLMSS